MLPLEARIRSFGRILGMIAAGIVVLWALILGATHHSGGPQMAPCPPQECALHPHAPHGPGG